MPDPKDTPGPSGLTPRQRVASDRDHTKPFSRQTGSYWPMRESKENAESESAIANRLFNLGDDIELPKSIKALDKNKGK